VPHVVDADEDGEDGGLEVEGVFLPAGLELGDFVSADAAVEDLEVEAGVGPEEIAADKEGVAASEGSLVMESPWKRMTSPFLRVGFVGFSWAEADWRKEAPVARAEEVRRWRRFIRGFIYRLSMVRVARPLLRACIQTGIQRLPVFSRASPKMTPRQKM
jgi:hypothetical protein